MLLSLLLALLWAAPSSAEPSAREVKKARAAEAFRIDAIVVDGLFLTKPNVVTRELLFGEGEVATRRQIEDSVQRLRNLGIFRIAEYELLDRRIPLPDGTLPSANEEHRVLLITVDERWTLIPFGTFAAGGGTFSLTTGLYDINLLGRYIQLGGQYQHFAGTNSFALWAEDPRFLGRRLSLGGSFVQSNRINVFYADSGEREGAHLRLRQSGGVSLNVEWLPWLRSGISLGYVNDEYSTQLLSPELVELELARGLPEQAQYARIGLSTTLGRLDANSFLRSGASLGWAVAASKAGVLSNLDYVDDVLQAIWFAVLPFRSNVGVRLGIGHTTSSRPEYDFFVGGFNILRGFLHRRYHGTHYWYGNAELRIPSIDTRWLVLQHVGFLDAAGVGSSFDVLGEIDGMSGGAGLRILSPKIFSLVARIDYAWSIIGDGRSALSFGAGQFF